MEEVKEDVTNLFNNSHCFSHVTHCDLCDQCSEPTIGYNVCYIVASVLFDEDRVLLMQEAKASCYGKWYLPAGKVEPGESFCEAAKREVLEETGLIMKPTGLIMTEINHNFWIRLVFSGKIVGGSLKTEDNKDKESLQAQWFSTIEPLTLRSKDIIPLIDAARVYYKSRERYDFEETLPYSIKQNINAVRVAFIINVKSVIYVLVVNNCNSERFKLPLVCLQTMNLSSLLMQILNRYLTSNSFCDINSFKIHLLGLEHSGYNSCDGIIFNVAVPLHNGVDKSLVFDQLPHIQGQVADWLAVHSDFKKLLMNNFYAPHTVNVVESWRYFPNVKTIR